MTCSIEEKLISHCFGFENYRNYSEMLEEFFFMFRWN